MSDVALRQHHREALNVDVDQAVIDVSASGDTSIVSGVAGKRIAVYHIFAMAGAAVTVKWKSGATDKIGPCAVAANGGYSIESNYPVMVTDVGDALVINLSGVVAVGGVLTYALID